MAAEGTVPVGISSPLDALKKRWPNFPTILPFVNKSWTRVVLMTCE